MIVLNEVRFSIPSLSVNESVARAVVSSFLVQAAFDALMERIKLLQQRFRDI